MFNKIFYFILKNPIRTVNFFFFDKISLLIIFMRSEKEDNFNYLK